MKVTFVPNSGEPVEVFESEDCSPEYQEYLQMMREDPQAQDNSVDYWVQCGKLHDAHVWAYYCANNLAPALSCTYAE